MEEHGERQSKITRERLDIVQDGDLILVFRNGLESDDESVEELRIRVASQVLRVASPVFGKMLSPNFGYRESAMIRKAALEPDNPAVIYLPDDKAISAQKVLLVLHHKVRDLQRVSFELLVDIAEFVEKYELQDACFKYASDWVNSLDDVRTWLEDEDTQSLKPGLENFIAVAWVFRCSDIFSSLSHELALRGAVNSNGELYFGTNDRKGKLAEWLPEQVNNKYPLINIFELGE